MLISHFPSASPVILPTQLFAQPTVPCFSNYYPGTFFCLQWIIFASSAWSSMYPLSIAAFIRGLQGGWCLSPAVIGWKVRYMTVERKNLSKLLQWEWHTQLLDLGGNSFFTFGQAVLDSLFLLINLSLNIVFILVISVCMGGNTFPQYCSTFCLLKKKN